MLAGMVGSGIGFDSRAHRVAVLHFWSIASLQEFQLPPAPFRDHFFWDIELGGQLGGSCTDGVGVGVYLFGNAAGSDPWDETAQESLHSL